ncbi:hypothetical protein HDE_01797 [Halotydeus destructor]|nr:hypothetical protein HDE_01797 [Halotydeus destructor]
MSHDSDVIAEAKNMYRSKMDDYVNSSPDIPTTWQLREKHQEFAFECTDEYRKKSRSNGDDSWKLEADLKSLFAEYVLSNKQSRQMALMRYALSDQSANATEAY